MTTPPRRRRLRLRLKENSLLKTLTTDTTVGDWAGRCVHWLV